MEAGLALVPMLSSCRPQCPVVSFPGEPQPGCSGPSRDPSAAEPKAGGGCSRLRAVSFWVQEGRLLALLASGKGSY